MKKIGLLILLSAFVCLCACSTSKGKTPEFECEEAYRPILEDFRKVISALEKPEFFYDGLNSVYEAAIEFEDAAEDTIGFVFRDINADGKEELFVGCFDTEGSNGVNNEIYAAFSDDGDSLTPLFEKQKRNTFALTDTGTFYFYGSDGSKFHIIAEYELTMDEGLVCKDFYFTYPKNQDKDEFGYYHNTSGLWDPACSQELDMTPDAFDEIRKNFEKRTVSLDDVKFSEIEN